MDCGVGWKLGSHGGGVAAPGSEAIVAWIWVVAMDVEMWLDHIGCLEKGTEGPCRPMTWAQLTLGL